ncbi:HD domain-containing protein, partial [candidate division WWE3 bacterium]|nr:HD domain-containing protein [candidate division WWE3 bacterium]
LVRWISDTGHNPKPVILHSVRVGAYLYNRGYSTNIVVVGFLHDVVEDSGATLDEVEITFGEEVAQLVAANSFDSTITDKVKRYQDTYERLVTTGRDALIVKAADILDNLPYYRIAENGDEYGETKIATFLDIAKPVIDSEIAYKDLDKRFQEEVQAKPRNNS